MNTLDWSADNLAYWTNNVATHVNGLGYHVEELIADPGRLSAVVRFDVPLLGRLEGLDVVHLQCHIGTDTLSLMRLGARSVVGYDFSQAALDAGRSIAVAAGQEGMDWVQGDLYDAIDRLRAARFDLVYTGVGALIWLPDIAGWARVVAGLLRPGGRLHLREGHPMLFAIDESLTLADPYFERRLPTTSLEPVTDYADPDVIVTGTTHEWNHGLGEVVTALLDAGLTITGLTEHDSIPWDAFPGQMTELYGGNEFQLTDRPKRLAHSYTLRATRN